MVGFQFFLFEGIGGVMPLMGATKDRKAFPMLLAGSLAFLTVIFIIFSEICYYTYGDKLDQPIITEMLPKDNVIVQIIKFAFIGNLVFSYPITIYITNIILEGFTFQTCKRKSATRRWLKNVQRSLVLLGGILLGLYAK